MLDTRTKFILRGRMDEVFQKVRSVRSHRKDAADQEKFETECNRILNSITEFVAAHLED